MTVESLKRVIWRLREKHPGRKTYSLKEVRRAIMYECGTDERTIIHNIKKLIELEILKRKKRWEFIDLGTTL